ncbi:hypothetical protein IFM89_020368 [Coptis chinensis]|uniref:Uncharacterized protein n=1 Tax=Coptis chinensis TaxID=261450 RepID=A0A835LNH8_9MAGN|nr:hypothetical protein IFM89_020368 [Coptis chinensis]
MRVVIPSKEYVSPPDVVRVMMRSVLWRVVGSWMRPDITDRNAKDDKSEFAILLQFNLSTIAVFRFLQLGNCPPLPPPENSGCVVYSASPTGLRETRVQRLMYEEACALSKSGGTSGGSVGLRVVIIGLGLASIVGFSVLLFKIWQKKKREEQHARLLRLFEEDDELELELGLRD